MTKLYQPIEIGRHPGGFVLFACRMKPPWLGITLKCPNIPEGRRSRLVRGAKWNTEDQQSIHMIQLYDLGLSADIPDWVLTVLLALPQDFDR